MQKVLCISNTMLVSVVYFLCSFAIKYMTFYQSSVIENDKLFFVDLKVFISITCIYTMSVFNLNAPLKYITCM